ncbi:MAG: glycosyltransferase N-terminal domain-containing protein [Candidatus Zixiibacteriota bacterium]
MLLYKIVTFIIYFVSLPYTFISALAGSLKWKQRLGWKHRTPDANPVDIWLHASSMGEVKVLGILLNQLKDIDTSLKIYLTVMTDSGYNAAKKFADKDTCVGFFPMDFATPIERFLGAVRPKVAVFIETEIWPNMIQTLGRNNIPIFLANGRLSEKAFGKYLHFKKAMSGVFENYTRMMVQKDLDKQRFVGIGARSDRIEAIGNLKFDAPIDIMPPEKKERIKESLPFDPNAKILIAGSTRNGENEIILDCYLNMVQEFPELRLILVPRHLDRIDIITNMALSRSLEYCHYSKRQQTSGDCHVMIVDKIGVLNDLYHISDAAFVGGTLTKIGGHNILEPVWAGIPVFYGPSIANVVDSSEYILAHNFGVQVSDGDELCHKLTSYFKGTLKFRKKTDVSSEPSRALQTAQIILNPLKSNAKDMAQNNRS